MRKATIWASSAVTLVAACHGDSNQAPLAGPVPHVGGPASKKSGPTTAELTAGMVEAVTIGASTVPVALKFELPQAPVVGAPLDVAVAVMPQIAADAAVLRVMGSNGLNLAPGTHPVEMSPVEPTQVYRHDIQIVPAAEGVQLLAMTVSLKHDDIVETREFSVPIIVAPSPSGRPSSSGGH